MTVQPKSYRVLVIGDVCKDVYIHTTYSGRENPEDIEAPLVNLTKFEEKQGMAANVATCLTNLGFTVDSIFGNNPSTKFRVVDSVGFQRIRIDSDQQSEPVDSLNSEINWVEYDAVVVSDYNKGTVSLDTLKLIVDNFNGPKFLDTKKTDIGELWPYFIVKINEVESYDYASELSNQSIITLGADGARKAFEYKSYPALKTEAVDVCGAGDAFLAGLVYGMFYGMFLEDIEYGIVNAGIAVSHMGTYAPTLKELDDAAEDYYDQTRRSN